MPAEFNNDSLFDPYIHGTTSSIFTLLEKTNYQILSPLSMAKHFQLVPINGEFFRGGYKALGFGKIDEDIMGQISFGKLATRQNPHHSDEYTLEKIGGYTQIPLRSVDALIQLFKEEANKSCQLLASNINILLILYGQIKQRGTLNQLDEIREDISKVQAIFSATEQFYNLLQLFGTHLYPNQQEMERAKNFLGGDKKLTNQIELLFSTENLIQKLINTKLDVGSIVANPSEDNLRLAMNFLDFSVQDSNSSLIANFNLFSTEKTELINPIFDRDYIKEYFDKMTYVYGSDRFHYWFPKFLQGGRFVAVFNIMASFAKDFVEIIQERVQVFNSMINAPATPSLTEEQKQELTNLFPVILTCESNENMVANSYEIRCTKPLTLGQDITLIATDSREHQITLMEYLQRHNLNHVNVVLFEDLYHARETKAKPNSISLDEVKVLFKEEQTRLREKNRLSKLIENKFSHSSDYMNRLFIKRSSNRDDLIRELRYHINEVTHSEQIIEKLESVSQQAQQHHETLSGFRFFGHPKLLFNKTCGFKMAVDEIITEFRNADVNRILL